jgi:hypothetical protein
VGASVAVVPHAVKTKVKMIKPTKILNIFVFIFSSLFSLDCFKSEQVSDNLCSFETKPAS